MSGDSFFSILFAIFWLNWAAQCYRKEKQKTARWTGVVGHSLMALCIGFFVFASALPGIFTFLGLVLLGVAFVLLAVSYRYSLMN